jgi:hypothetical protein
MECNKIIFEDGSSSLQSVFDRTLDWLDNSKTFQQVMVPRQLPPILKEDIPVGWFDGATQLH